MIENLDGWSVDWAWGIPLIVFTMLAHGFALVQIHEWVVVPAAESLRKRPSNTAIAAVAGATALLVTVLHAAEATLWAVAYVELGALSDARLAMLFSLNAMTAYGHDNLGLEAHWRLLGALEALNGVILFGLTTAFLFSVLQGIWQIHAHNGRKRGD